MNTLHVDDPCSAYALNKAKSLLTRDLDFKYKLPAMRQAYTVDLSTTVIMF